MYFLTATLIICYNVYSIFKWFVQSKALRTCVVLGLCTGEAMEESREQEEELHDVFFIFF